MKYKFCLGALLIDFCFVLIRAKRTPPPFRFYELCWYLTLDTPWCRQVLWGACSCLRKMTYFWRNSLSQLASCAGSNYTRLDPRPQRPQRSEWSDRPLKGRGTRKNNIKKTKSNANAFKTLIENVQQNVTCEKKLTVSNEKK